MSEKRWPSYATQRRSLWQRGYRHCYYCEVRLTMALNLPHTLTLDHKIPLARNGPNKPSNYVAACGKCNSEKGCMTEAEYWAIRRRRASRVA